MRGKSTGLKKTSILLYIIRSEIDSADIFFCLHKLKIPIYRDSMILGKSSKSRDIIPFKTIKVVTHLRATAFQTILEPKSGLEPLTY